MTCCPGDKSAAHYWQLRAEPERLGKPCGAHDVQIGGHARSEGLIVVTNDVREFSCMPGVRVGIGSEGEIARLWAAGQGLRPEIVELNV